MTVCPDTQQAPTACTGCFHPLDDIIDTPMEAEYLQDIYKIYLALPQKHLFRASSSDKSRRPYSLRDDVPISYTFKGALVMNHVNAGGVAIPKLGVRLQRKLGHETSSTASEFAAIREAVRYVLSQPPQGRTAFSDSKPALQVLKNAGRQTKYFQLALATQLLLSTSFQLGHSVAVQWVPGHCRIHGNEPADAAANAALKSTSTVNIPVAPSDVNRCARAPGT